jgi:hypothetical protein
MCRIWNFFVACGASLPKFSDVSRQNWEVAETIFSSGASRVTVPDELIEMVQYNITGSSCCCSSKQSYLHFTCIIRQQKPLHHRHRFGGGWTRQWQRTLAREDGSGGHVEIVIVVADTCKA